MFKKYYFYQFTTTKGVFGDGVSVFPFYRSPAQAHNMISKNIKNSVYEKLHTNESEIGPVDVNIIRFERIK